MSKDALHGFSFMITYMSKTSLGLILYLTWQMAQNMNIKTSLMPGTENCFLNSVSVIFFLKNQGWEHKFWEILDVGG